MTTPLPARPQARDTGYPANPATLGEHLRKRRIDLKLFQKDIARIIGVDEASIWNWENNRTKPVLKLVPEIIEFLGYNPQIQEI